MRSACRFVYIYLLPWPLHFSASTLQRVPAMASPLSGAAAGFERECREIHDACRQPPRLGLLLAPRSPSERQQIRAAYRAMFGEDLAGALQRIVVANQENEVKTTAIASAHLQIASAFTAIKLPPAIVPLFQFCKVLYLWTLEPADRDAIIAREAVEGGMTVAGYRALVEVFTRRKHNQLFFTKQAYMSRFRRNLEQDMVTEPSHACQRARSHHSSPVLSEEILLQLSALMVPTR